MSDALPLPSRPNLEQYKKLAKDLQSACKSTDPGAIHGWTAHWTETESAAARIEQRWLQFKESSEPAARCSLSAAQLFLARSHGFASWPKFSAHLKASARAGSPISRFEAAADAIVNGEVSVLRTLLTDNPELVRARSTRAHQSTLLHYVSANGVEDYRQKTPANIVEIADLLLTAGSGVNAESNAYGGAATTLGLTATSWHPEQAGVQLPLLSLLLDHGASMGNSAVTGCLANGRGQAAEFLANRGAPLDIEGAAGIGRLDLVQSLYSSATQKQVTDGFAWACEFGRTEVVDYLLQQGMDVAARLRHFGQTGLHWAAYGGHPDVVRLLLEHGAPIDAKDDTYGGTPLDWALYAQKTAPRESHDEVVALLGQAATR
jgi:hypothetical protein